MSQACFILFNSSQNSNDGLSVFRAFLCIISQFQGTQNKKALNCQWVSMWTFFLLLALHEPFFFLIGVSLCQWQ